MTDNASQCPTQFNSQCEVVHSVPGFSISWGVRWCLGACSTSPTQQRAQNKTLTTQSLAQCTTVHSTTTTLSVHCHTAAYLTPPLAKQNNLSNQEDSGILRLGILKHKASLQTTQQCEQHNITTLGGDIFLVSFQGSRGDPKAMP